MTDKTYLPIKDFGLIGDLHTAALVSKTGSIDWCCWPDFDSPAVFCKLLDSKLGGSFAINPLKDFVSSQRYIEGTNVLQTVFETGARMKVTNAEATTGAEAAAPTFAWLLTARKKKWRFSQPREQQHRYSMKGHPNRDFLANPSLLASSLSLNP